MFLRGVTENAQPRETSACAKDAMAEYSAVANQPWETKIEELSQ
jgi:hypothetical protein